MKRPVIDWRNFSPPQAVYFMGICGTAMASLAGLLKAMGYSVRGSDQNVYPPMSTQLENLQIEVKEGYSPSNLLPRPDLVVVGNVISKHFPEAAALVASGIPYVSLPEAMGALVIADLPSFVVAGTHGKTSTTAGLSWVAEQMGLNPGFMIGGVPLDFPYSFRRSDAAKIFVIEGDEYDTAFFDKGPKFWHYRAKHLIITSLEFDHADIYPDLDAIETVFKKLVTEVPANGSIVFCGDSPLLGQLVAQALCPTYSYGFGEHNDFRIVGLGAFGDRQHWQVIYNNQKYDLCNKSFGPHVALNMTAVLAMALTQNWPAPAVLGAIASFRGVKRRQEVLVNQDAIKVIEDFAHHPTAVSLTIEGLRLRYPDFEIRVAFEPRSATARRKVFQKDFARSLSGADRVMIAVPHDQSKIPETERLDASALAQDVANFGTPVAVFDSIQPIVTALFKDLTRPTVICVMSNGGFGGIYEQIKAAAQTANTRLTPG